MSAKTCEACGTSLTEKDWGDGGKVWNDDSGSTHHAVRCQAKQIEALCAAATALVDAVEDNIADEDTIAADAVDDVTRLTSRSRKAAGRT